MIPILVALAVGAAVGAVVVTFWDEIKKILKVAYKKVEEQIVKLTKAALIGFTTYVKGGTALDGVKAAFKFYSKDAKGQFQETTVTKTISESELPPEIRAKLENNNGNLTDISKEMELALS